MPERWGVWYGPRGDNRTACWRVVDRERRVWAEPVIDYPTEAEAKSEAERRNLDGGAPGA